MTTTAVVVMEPGSDWPGQIGDSMNVVASGLGGEDLLGRTRAKLDALRRTKQDVRVAVLACGAAAGELATDWRTQVARALLDAAARARGGRLILCAGERASLPLRQELLTLAGALTEKLRGTATVSLRFTEAPAVRVTKTRRATTACVTG